MMPIRIWIRLSILMPIQIRIRIVHQVLNMFEVRIFLLLCTAVSVYIVLSFIISGKSVFYFYIWLKWIRIRIGKPGMPIRLRIRQNDADQTRSESTTREKRLRFFCRYWNWFHPLPSLASAKTAIMATSLSSILVFLLSALQQRLAYSIYIRLVKAELLC
jgi:hypothetical protein